MKLTLCIVILISQIANSKSEAEEKIQMLLLNDRKRDIEMKIYDFDKQQGFKRECKSELIAQAVPFSCYRLKNPKVNDLNKICAQNASSLQKEGLPKVKWVSPECKIALAPYIEKLNYIKSAENPSAIYFNE